MPLKRCLLVSLFAATSACGDRTPPVTPSTATPGAVTAPVMTRLEVSGPDSVPPGGTVQLTATAHLSDGTTRVVTNEATWESFHDTLTVQGKGLIVAGSARGEGEINVTYNGIPRALPGPGWASRKLYVLPAGTFLLYGVVRDEGVYLNDVRVEVTAGNMAGSEVIANGFFRFYGVSGDTEIRVSKAGYDTVTRRIAVAGHHTEEVGLVLSGGRVTLDGVYTLTISAAAECRDLLPAGVRDRSFQAVVTQTGAKLRVVLQGADMASPYGPANAFGGTAEANRALFVLHGPEGDDTTSFSPAEIMQRLTPPDVYYMPYGIVVASPNGSGLSGFFSGNVEIAKTGGPWDYGKQYKVESVCSSSAHQFTIAR